MLRLFTAIDLPASCRVKLVSAQHRLRQAGLSASWIPEDNLHLSLVFLGDAEEERLPTVIQCIQHAARDIPPFSFAVTGLGLFGSPRRPRVLWAGVDAPAELSRLQARLDAAFNENGFPTESRPYHPHITLARIRPHHHKKNPSNMGEVITKNPFKQPVPVEVAALYLMQSVLSSSGACHTLLYEHPLN